MPCCLKCGREVEAGLELFCPRCLEKSEKDEWPHKVVPSLFRQRPGTIFIYLAFIVVLVFGIVFWRQTDPPAPQLAVPGSFSTIQAGIAAAGPGEIIILEPGVYHENIDFLGKAITLRSTRPKDPEVVATTVIQGNGKAPTVLFKSGETDETVLQGLTIAGGAVSQGNNAGSLTVVAAGGVIFIDAGSTPMLLDNVITSGTAKQGGAIYINNSSPSITNNIIRGNQAHWEGGALYIGEGSKPAIRENTIFNNSAETGGAIYILKAAPLIKDNRIGENSAAHQGGGIMVQGGAPEITGNSFEHNRAGECGGAAALFNASPLLRDNHFSNNTGGWRGGGALYIGLRSAPQLTQNTFSQNDATHGKDIWVSADSSLQTVPNATIYYQD